ncbi:GNAT family N-acetyltransferase [Kribbella catacumbae]|uniref:GNAT family N-acetyltransferase n=1 Tax=Kribbella catacumbae TaxID=460086 RepID=UPI0003788755|nr:GNAT family N-acetyltransferase [Kribbella catacumbae]
MISSLSIRRGGRDDVAAVLEMLDKATDWLVARGRTDQWGTEAHSTNPRRVEQIEGFVADEGLWVAELAGRVVGALAVGEALPYVPPATEPELYIRLLVTDRTVQGSGIGTDLLEHARTLARGLGVELLRVDCFGGGDGALIRYYEEQGFTRAEPFGVQVSDSEWPGQLLYQRL